MELKASLLAIAGKLVILAWELNSGRSVSVPLTRYCLTIHLALKNTNYH